MRDRGSKGGKDLHRQQNTTHEQLHVASFSPLSSFCFPATATYLLFLLLVLAS